MYDEQKTPEQDPYEQQLIQLTALGSRLQGQVDALVRDREPIERRMLEDLRQFKGLYEPELLTKIKATGGSEAFTNITLTKCNTLEAQIADALLQVDGENWAIKPTAIPEIADRINDDTQIGTTEQGHPVLAQDMARAIRDIAEERAQAMQTLMADQLGECGYNAEQRETIHDGVVLGTGIIKGVALETKTTRTFKQVQDGQGGLITLPEADDKIVPVAKRVDPFEFFPDLSAKTIADAEFVFERHYLTRKQLRRMAKNKSFISSQIRTLLLETETPNTALPTHLNAIREMSGEQTLKESRYQLWEYHGSVKRSELEACGCVNPSEDDPLEEIQACVWFVEGKIIKATTNPSEDDELPYSVFTLQTDGTSIFGTGVPRQMQHSQRVINACYRTMLDNAALTARPQIIIDKSVVQPENGKWVIESGKIWSWDSKYQGGTGGNPFVAVEIKSSLSDLMALFNLAIQLASEETGIYPQQGQGEHSKFLNETATGAAMAFNSMMVLIGRYVKRYDDLITKPTIKRLYEYNMLYSTDAKVKGDYEINATGTSSLLDRETATQGIMQAAQLVTHPILGKFIDPEGLVEELAKVYRLPKRLMRSADAIKQLESQAPQQDPMIAIKQKELEIKAQKLQQDGELGAKKIEQQAQDSENDLQRAQLASSTRIAELQQSYETFMANLASNENISVAQLNAKLGIEKQREATKAAMFNAEIAVKTTQGSGI